MRSTRVLLACSLLLAWAWRCSADDLSKIERIIKKEPAYKTKPRYCLLVFGPEAKTRVWLVFDGDTLHVDRNGNGDLTEEGKRCGLPGGGLAIDTGDKTKYKLEVSPPVEDHQVYCGVAVLGRYYQYASLKPASRPQDAPVCHFAGPL